MDRLTPIRQVRTEGGDRDAKGAEADQGSGRGTLSDDQLIHRGAVVGNDCEGNDVRHNRLRIRIGGQAQTPGTRQ